MIQLSVGQRPVFIESNRIALIERANFHQAFAFASGFSFASRTLTRDLWIVFISAAVCI